MMQVKLCGLTQADQIIEADQLGISYLGLIFHPKSPRYVASKLNPEELTAKPMQAKLTGVFVDEPMELMNAAMKRWGLKALQLHGNESPQVCRLLHSKVEVIKVISVQATSSSATLQQEVDRYAGVVHKYLFDTQRGDVRGGTGLHFDWSLLHRVQLAHPFFLSGGINYSDYRTLQSFSHPAWAGIDINSKFELEPGVKNMTLVEQFVQRVNSKP
jgi:phosphoribosylanthranilate isomerase